MPVGDTGGGGELDPVPSQLRNQLAIRDSNDASFDATQAPDARDSSLPSASS